MSTMTLDTPTRPATVDSDLLGPVLVSPEAHYAFPTGLYGFEACRDFVLVPAGRDALYWLQSTEEPGLVFLLAEPGRYFPDHKVDVPAPDLQAFAGSAATSDEFAAFTVVTLGEEHGAATANLQAPVVFHGPTRTARQIVLADGRQRVRVPLAIA